MNKVPSKMDCSTPGGTADLSPNLKPQTLKIFKLGKSRLLPSAVIGPFAQQSWTEVAGVYAEEPRKGQWRRDG